MSETELETEGWKKRLVRGNEDKEKKEKISEGVFRDREKMNERGNWGAMSETELETEGWKKR